MVKNDAVDVGRIPSQSSSGGLIYTSDPSLKTYQAVAAVQQWIEAVTHSDFPYPDLIESIRDGVLLCKLVNTIHPGIVESYVVDPTPNDYAINVKSFLKGCSDFGLSDRQLFEPRDLEQPYLIEAPHELQKKSKEDTVIKVVNTIYWLGVIVRGMSYYQGPQLDLTAFHRQDGIHSIKQNGSVPFDDDRRVNMDYRQNQRNSLTNEDSGTYHNGDDADSDSLQEEDEIYTALVELLPGDSRFGFSVIGGIDEGFPARIDEVTEDSPADRVSVEIGDEILEVNGQTVEEETHQGLIKKIHQCIANRRILLKLRRGTWSPDYLENGQHLNDDNQGSVDPLTRQRLQQIIQDQENDPQFQQFDTEYIQSLTKNFSSTTKLNTAMDENGYLGAPPGGLYNPAFDDDNPMASYVDRGNQYYENSFGTHSNLTDPRQLASNELTVDGPYGGYSINNIRDSYIHAVEDSPSRSAANDLESVSASEMNNCFENLQREIKDNKDRDCLVFLQRLMRQQEFQRSVQVHNKIAQIQNSGQGPSSLDPQATNAQQLATQVQGSMMKNSRSQDAVELLHILQKPDVKALLVAHDRIASQEALPGEDEQEEEESDKRHSRTPDSMNYSHVADDTVKIVRIDKSNEPLGATVRNEGSSVVIGRIVKGGAAEKSGLLHEGDEVLEINGVNMRGRTVAEVCELLADMSGTLTFVLKPTTSAIGISSHERELHIRAMFDYDPSSDEYIPCRELGLPFRCGDILHVVKQDDPNWWQAWKSGEEGRKLAGLIPGKNFQQQREALKTTIKETTPTNEKKNLWCMKCKRKKKVLYNPDNDVYDMDEVLTYEEVGLLQPDSRRRRPIILIGPMHIGRRELRQRLLQYAPDRFAPAIPHTSRAPRSGEVNGKEYHFISKNTFESQMKEHKFVEYGMFENNYYGTSLESIRNVVMSGKTCIINLHCKGLKFLKNSDLKPYVIFLTTPTFEKIRRMRNGNVDAFNPHVKLKDDEIRDMIVKAREMDDMYSHYFDTRVTNLEFEKTFDDLLKMIDKVEREAQWVPVRWVT